MYSWVGVLPANWSCVIKISKESTRRIGLVWKTIKKRSEAFRSEVDFAQFMLCFTKLVLLK